MYTREIGELCREGKTIYYILLWGGIVESDSRDYLVRLLVRWNTRHITGDYCEEIQPEGL